MRPERSSRGPTRGGRRLARLLGDPRAHPNLTWLRELLGGRERETRMVLAELHEATNVHTVVRGRHREGGRASYAQFRAPFELYAIVRLLRPSHVVETGVSSGGSSAYILLALRRNRHGTLHSIDQPLRQRRPQFDASESPVALPPGRETGWAMPEHLRAGWDLRLGPSQQLLPALVRELPRLGIFLHDSLHTPTHLRFELETVRPKLAPGAIVLADNTAWTGKAFPRFARSLGARVCRRGRSDLVGLRVPECAEDPAVS